MTDVEPNPGSTAEVCVLGSVGISRGDHGEFAEYPSAVGRALLAALALGGRTGLSATRLVAVVWGGEAVRDSTLSVTAHRVRRWLTDVTENAAGIRCTAGGYALELTDADTDVTRFRALVARAGPADEAAKPRLLGAAVRLWRGPALANVPPARADAAEVAGLERERVLASVKYAQALLKASDPEPAAQLLLPLAQLYPLDERVAAALIQVLAATGRQADALSIFERLRGRLRDELGTDPGPELRAAFLRVLRGEVADALADR